MSVVATLRFILNHPVGRRAPIRCLSDWARWQAGARIVQGSVAVPWVSGARLLVSPGMTGATGNVYVGLHEFEEMAFCAHLLRPGELFVDVGANVGSYSVLMGVAAGARTLSFEPHPATYQRLLDNLHLNDLGARAQTRQAALGAAPGEVELTATLDTVNHVRAAGETEPGVRVPVLRLDDVLAGEAPSAMKIDVEGFESHVLAGAPQALSDPRLLCVIMELNGSGSRYGVRDEDLHATMIDAGLAACRYEPFARRLTLLDTSVTPFGNGLYVRRAHLAEVQRRLSSAPPLEIKGLRV